MRSISMTSAMTKRRVRRHAEADANPVSDEPSNHLERRTDDLIQIDLTASTRRRMDGEEQFLREHRCPLARLQELAQLALALSLRHVLVLHSTHATMTVIRFRRSCTSCVIARSPGFTAGDTSSRTPSGVDRPLARGVGLAKSRLRRVTNDARRPYEFVPRWSCKISTIRADTRLACRLDQTEKLRWDGARPRLRAWPDVQDRGRGRDGGFRTSRSRAARVPRRRDERLSERPR